MKNVYILGNWKANKGLADAAMWIDAFRKNTQPISPSVHIILCPGYHHLSQFLEAKLPFLLGAQDISQYAEGAYTGEVAARMVQGVVTHALIGHSERRKNFFETDDIVAQKVLRCIEAGIMPVVCVSEITQVQTLLQAVPDFSKHGMLLYEPLAAIGTGQPQNAETANEKAKEIHGVMPVVPILYGGSVTADTIGGFVTQSDLSGVGIGGASLDPEKFFACITHASELVG